MAHTPTNEQKIATANESYVKVGPARAEREKAQANFTTEEEDFAARIEERDTQAPVTNDVKAAEQAEKAAVEKTKQVGGRLVDVPLCSLLRHSYVDLTHSPHSSSHLSYIPSQHTDRRRARGAGGARGGHAGAAGGGAHGSAVGGRGGEAHGGRGAGGGGGRMR